LNFSNNNFDEFIGSWSSRITYHVSRITFQEVFTMQLDSITINWLGHDGFRIQAAGLTIYVDPFQLKSGEPADVVFITHDHFDHLHEDSLKVISKPTTVTVAADQADAKKKLRGNVRWVKTGDALTEQGIQAKVVPAYNVRDDRQKFHPKTYGGVGYVLAVGGKTLYHVGDTDPIPEMSNVGGVDVAFVPVSGTYVCDANEGAECVKLIKPKIAVPMHYGAIVGSDADAAKFRDLAGGLTKVEVLQKTT
jgi:L-ascorbate metabolism protein UlaG (beta-lactamase superfamily)